MSNLSILLCGEKIKPWDRSEGLTEQLEGVEKIIVNYSIENHENIQRFIGDLKLLLKISVMHPIKIDVYYDNEVMGARIKKDVKKLEKSIQLCWVTKEVVDCQLSTISKMSYIDSRLSEMSASLNKVVK